MNLGHFVRSGTGSKWELRYTKISNPDFSWGLYPKPYFEEEFRFEFDNIPHKSIITYLGEVAIKRGSRYRFYKVGAKNEKGEYCTGWMPEHLIEELFPYEPC